MVGRFSCVSVLFASVPPRRIAKIASEVCRGNGRAIASECCACRMNRSRRARTRTGGGRICLPKDQSPRILRGHRQAGRSRGADVGHRNPRYDGPIPRLAPPRFMGAESAPSPAGEGGFRHGRPPCPSRASGWSSLTTSRGLPRYVRFPCVHAVATTPAQRLSGPTSLIHSAVSAFPERVVGSARASSFSRCSAFTHVTACTLARSPNRDPLSRGRSHFVTSMAAPVASGWSICRVGLAPTTPGPDADHNCCFATVATRPRRATYARQDNRTDGEQGYAATSRGRAVRHFLADQMGAWSMMLPGRQ
jgi:hypothetical protein